MRRPFLRRLIQAIVILILFFYAFQKRETLAQIAWVFAAASVLTLVLSPACTLLERKGFRPASASAVCILGLVLLAVLALSAFIPYLFASTADLIRRIIPTPVSYTHLLSSPATKGCMKPKIRRALILSRRKAAMSAAPA